MQKPLISLALSGMMIFAGGAAFAQTDSQQAPAQQQAAPAPGGEMHHAMDPDKQVKHLSHRLNLTADQQNQILPILTDRQQQMKAVWQDQSLSRKDRHAKVMSIRDDSNAKIEAVLNDTQKQQFEQMQQQAKERHNHNKQNAAPPAQQQ